MTAFRQRDKAAASGPVDAATYSVPDRLKGDSAKPAASGAAGESPGASVVMPSKVVNSQGLSGGPISRTTAQQA